MTLSSALLVFHLFFEFQTLNTLQAIKTCPQIHSFFCVKLSILNSHCGCGLTTFDLYKSGIAFHAESAGMGVITILRYVNFMDFFNSDPTYLHSEGSLGLVDLFDLFPQTRQSKCSLCLCNNSVCVCTKAAIIIPSQMSYRHGHFNKLENTFVVLKLHKQFSYTAHTYCITLLPEVARFQCTNPVQQQTTAVYPVQEEETPKV